MEFLDMSLTKDSSLLLHAIHSPFYWQILKKAILFSGLQKSLKQEKIWEDSSLCPEASTKNAV